MPEDLGAFEGVPVEGVAIVIPSVAGGLVEPMKVEPVVLHAGDEAWVVFHLRAGEIRHTPRRSKEDDSVILGFTRVQRLDVLNATFVDEDLVSSQLASMAARVAERKEAAKLAKERNVGVQRVDGVERLEADHDEGLHAEEMVKGCPSCQAELDALEAESG